MCVPVVTRLVTWCGPAWRRAPLRRVAGRQDCDHQVPQRAGEVLLPAQDGAIAGVDDVDRPARRRLVGGRHGEDLADDVFAAVGVGEAPGVERSAAYSPVPADLGDPDPHPEQFAPAGGTPSGLCLRLRCGLLVAGAGLADVLTLL